MRTVPAVPRWLGLGGILPPMAGVAGLYVGPPEWHDALEAAMVSWAALALTFLGGSWWGLAAGAPAAERRGTLGWLWVASVLAPLTAFAFLLSWAMNRLPDEAALVMLASTLLLSTGIDAKLGPLAPRWWLALRLPFAIATASAALAVAIA